MRELVIYIFLFLFFLLVLGWFLLRYKTRKKIFFDRKIKKKYIDLINGLIEYLLIKDHFTFKIVLAKLDHLKELINLASFDDSEENKPFETELDVLLNDLYSSITNPKPNMDKLYMEIETVIIFIYKRSRMAKSKDKKSK